MVLDARLQGEGNALVTVLTEAHGAFRGLARGGGSRAQASLWQVGNLVQARWVARLADQLGTLSAELVHPGAALAMEDALTLAVLSAGCAVAEGALPEREPHPGVFAGLVKLVAGLSGEGVPALVRWETVLLAELGYGLDLTTCAVTGGTAELVFVSPRTGRAVSRTAAGPWQSRLLTLPGFLVGGSNLGPDGGPAEWRDGLALTGHFLERDAFGHQHRPLPTARHMLYDRVQALAAAQS